MQFKSTIFISLLAIFTTANAAPGQPKLGDVIKGQYIIIMKDTVSETDFKQHRERIGSRVGKTSNEVGSRTYSFGKLKGYSGKFDDATIEQIAKSPEVAFVEPDQVILSNALVTQSNVPSWGLARISHRNRGFTTYVYDNTAGTGMTAYVIDSGVLTTHVQFGGRATCPYNNVAGEAATDLYGHGTHVAATIAGTTVGVAKSARIIGVKVLDKTGAGTISGAIAGIQWTVSNAQSTGKIGKSIVNMSLGSGYSAAFNQAVTNAIAAGIPFAVAAGNNNGNVANYSPGSTANAITVGATTSTDAKASYSNYGAGIDIWAPGTGIYSAWIGSNTAYLTISGTSMATPHVAGVGAYLMRLNAITTPAALLSKLIALNTPNKITGITGVYASPNRLLYNGSGL